MIESFFEALGFLWNIAKQLGLELMIILSICFIGIIFRKDK